MMNEMMYPPYSNPMAPTPNMPGMPNNNMMLEQKVNMLEREIRRLEERVTKLETHHGQDKSSNTYDNYSKNNYMI